MSFPKVPQVYLHHADAFGFNEISLGYCGIQLCPLDEIPDWQVGYSVSTDGKPLNESRWPADWLVFARETSLGDPILMDVSKSGYPVMTAMPGIVAWQSHVIATSLDSFFAGLAEFRALAVGRTSPVELEGNPLSDETRREYLTKIQDLNRGSIDLEFWDLLIGSEEPLDYGALRSTDH